MFIENETVDEQELICGLLNIVTGYFRKYNPFIQKIDEQISVSHLLSVRLSLDISLASKYLLTCIFL